MRNHIVVALLLSMIAAPTLAADATWYWDRYAVASSSERVPADSATSPAYRNQYAVFTQEQARAEASARAGSTGADGAAHHEASTAAKKETNGGCKCCEQHS